MTATGAKRPSADAGNDVFHITDVSALANGTVYGGTGTDTLLLEEAAAAGDAIFAGANGFEKVIYKNSNNDTATLGANAEATGITEATVDGTTGDLTAAAYTTAIKITAGTTTSDITGGAGADTLIGGAGDNVITSSAGNDTMTGNAGVDTFTVDGGSAQTVTVTDFLAGDDGLAVTNALATVNVTVKDSDGGTAADQNQRNCQCDSYR